jgi:Ca2+-binding EF-hand superfamily protein
MRCSTRQAIDADKDSSINIADLRAFLAAMAETVPADVVQAMIDAADSDGDGKLSFEDFARLAKVIDGAAA